MHVVEKHPLWTRQTCPLGIRETLSEMSPMTSSSVSLVEMLVLASRCTCAYTAFGLHLCSFACIQNSCQQTTIVRTTVELKDHLGSVCPIHSGIFKFWAEESLLIYLY